MLSKVFRSLDRIIGTGFIQLKIPEGMVNVAVTKNNFLIANTNNSRDWKYYKRKLPKGEWSIYSVENNNVSLIRKGC